MPACGPQIAVIVPNRNDARYLPRCLRSVLEQQPAAAEVIVVDDQSTDDSAKVIASLIAAHPQARLVENPVNLGVNGCINEGIRHSRSSHVVVVASNDFILPGIFGRAKACLARVPDAGLWSALSWLVDLEDRPIRLHPSPLVALRDAYLPPGRCIELALRHGNWFTGTTVIYRRDALEEAGYFHPDYMGMSDLFTALVVASRHGAAYSPAPYAAVRLHPNNYLTRTLSDAKVLEDLTPRPGCSRRSSWSGQYGDSVPRRCVPPAARRLERSRNARPAGSRAPFGR